MLSKKVIFVILISIYFGNEYYSISVPNSIRHLEISPVAFKLSQMVLNRLATLIDIASDLNFVKKHEQLRSLIEKVYLPNETHKIDKSITVKIAEINGVSVNIYSSVESKKTKMPIMIFYHGGAYIAGSSDNYGFFLSELVRNLDILVISVNYRLIPEHPYPAQLEDCQIVTDYVFSNISEFNGDQSKIILAGDSAGGNAAAVISQRLLKEKKNPTPRAQVLIYPVLEYFNLELPSVLNSKEELSKNKLVSLMLENNLIWFLDIKNITGHEFRRIINSKEHYALLDDEKRNKILSLLDSSLIATEFKEGKAYYTKYTAPSISQIKLPDTHILNNDKNIVEKTTKLFTNDISPILADIDELKDTPDTHIIVVEDVLKDQQLVYASRLKNAGVNVNIAFYENGFHGQITMLDSKFGREMFKDLVAYLKEKI